MAGSDYFLPGPSLLCLEDADACLSGGEANDDIDFSLFPMDTDSCVMADENCPYSNDAGNDDEYIDGLINREITFGCRGGCRAVSADAVDGSWLQDARVGAVRWILRMHALFGFGPETAYLAVNFLDRFLVKRTVESRHRWAIQLLSVACLSVAAKLEECRVPALSEFWSGEFYFDAKAILRMELLVLSTLEWRLRSVTPFPYLIYLVTRTKRGQSQSLSRRSDVMVRAISFLFTAIESMSSVDFRPSVLATAAFFAASGQAPKSGRVLELDCEAGVVASFRGSLQQEHLFSCYTAILESWNRKQQLSTDRKRTVLPFPGGDGNTSLLLESDDNHDNTSTDLTNSKRRRLALKGYSNCYCSISTSESKDKKAGPSIQLD